MSWQETGPRVTHFHDLSRYSYSKSEIPDTNIGWLSRWRPFRRGIAPADFVEALALQVRMPRNQMRGYHRCPFCVRFGNEMASVQISGTEFHLGSAEVHAFSHGKTFSAPNLVYHYVVRHDYLPPIEFIDAVISGAEGRVADSVVMRLRVIIQEAFRMEDRVDAAIDLLQISPDESVSWLEGLINNSSCHPYFKQRLESALRVQ